RLARVHGVLREHRQRRRGGTSRRGRVEAVEADGTFFAHRYGQVVAVPGCQAHRISGTQENTTDSSHPRHPTDPTTACHDGGMDAVTSAPEPVNEPVRTYAPGSAERASLQARIAELEGTTHELTMTIGGQQRMAGGDRIDVVQPHDHRHVLGVTAQATNADVAEAMRAAQHAAQDWQELPFDERAAVLLRAADLLSGPWRDTLNAATILGQSKSVQQAEIDSACELIDFWRFNVGFASRLLAEQPHSSRGIWNRFDHRPLAGF